MHPNTTVSSQPLSPREHAPSIIFMDEVDSIGSARMDNSGGGGDSEVQRTMLELLNQLDGFEASNKIKVGAFMFAAGNKTISIPVSSIQVVDSTL